MFSILFNRAITSRASAGDDASGGGSAGNAAAGNVAGPFGAIPSSKLLRNIKGIIFDFDGTLFDNALLPFYLISAYPFDMLRLWNERLIRKRFAGMDFSSPEEYYRAFFYELGKACSRPSERMRHWYFNHYMPRMARVLKKHYLPRPGVRELFNRFNAHARARSNNAASPGIEPALPAIPKIAIYSDYPYLKERLEALGIFYGPDVLLYSPESFGAQKPAVRPFIQIAGDIGAKPEEVLVIGDREETDGLGAFKAGMRFFCLETGRRHYFRLDPYRSPANEKAEPHGPSLLMYAGAWEDLMKLLKEKYG